VGQTVAKWQKCRCGVRRNVPCAPLNTVIDYTPLPILCLENGRRVASLEVTGRLTRYKGPNAAATMKGAGNPAALRWVSWSERATRA